VNRDHPFAREMSRRGRVQKVYLAEIDPSSKKKGEYTQDLDLIWIRRDKGKTRQKPSIASVRHG